MRFSIEIQGIPKAQEPHWNGILLSFFATVEDILHRRRKSSYIVHFFRERLERTEQKEFLRILSKISSQLAKQQRVALSGSAQDLKEDQQIPEKLARVLKSLRGVSALATAPRQTPKARVTPTKAEEVSNLIAEEILIND